MTGVRVEPRRRLADSSAFNGSAEQIVTMLGHPLRREILRRLHRVGEARSPRELAVSVGCDLSEVAHHVSILETVGALALTDTISERGTIENFYISTVEDDGGICLVLVATQRPDEGQ